MTHVSSSALLFMLCLTATALAGCPFDNNDVNNESNSKSIDVTPDLVADEALDAPGDSTSDTGQDAQADVSVEDSSEDESSGTRTAFRLGSWNANRLDADLNSGTVPRTEQDVALLKSYADKMNADIIALQEVDGEQAAARLFDPAEFAFHFTARNSSERVGFAFRKGLDVEIHPDVTSIQHGNNLRWGADVTLTREDGSSIRMLNVHLKSKCWSTPEGGTPPSFESATSCQTLTKQGESIDEWIQARRDASEAFVVVGDFNHNFISDDMFWMRFWADDATQDLNSPTFTQNSTCYAQFPNYIEHIAMSPEIWSQVKPNSFEQTTFSSEDLNASGGILSDHCPMVVEIQGE